MQFFDTLWSNIVETSIIEWAAVISGILYVIFAARKQMICWLFALISSGLYIYICYSYQLYIETGLQVFYVAMAIVGWWSWKRTTDQTIVQTSADLLDGVEVAVPDIKTWSANKHAINIGIGAVITAVVGFLFMRFTDQQNPFLDAFTTVFSLGATFMVVQKVLENWLYWIIIDLAGIYLYANRGLQLSAVLYFVFTVLAIVGFVSWYRQMKNLPG